MLLPAMVQVRVLPASVTVICRVEDIQSNTDAT
ncbi:Uncharacterised protein [Mycobacteroides abscessus subsp. abscessus]|nr:hypothetical protein E3G43_001083 [Mycobacteroides abscessus]SIJ60504.1 Uncharacterised protein [Mycobacteroides abscessus subsp. abscessus]SIL37850.1 Uncharacterised protein [Mycobacteroides abscessus subsp. abscessus]SIM87144.1 Uncharacterised protein [Mycobacteroides abscessus subsp. abscessus]SLI69330.1 Uncharacterised protein [Mycobacteroides abscessus subsp. abscessus]